MNTKFQYIESAPGLRVQSSNHQETPAGVSAPAEPKQKHPRIPLKRRKAHHLPDPAQAELFAVVWLTSPRHPRRLRAGDVIRIEGRLGRVIRVNECAAVIIVNRPVRAFTTRFDKHVRFQPQPALFRISPNSEVPILNP